MARMSVTMTMNQALVDVGVGPSTLTAGQCEQLDRLGYTMFPEMVDPAWLAGLRDAFERICAEEGERAGAEVSQMPGVRRLADLANKSEAFDGIYLNSRVLAAAQYVIGRPFKLSSVNGHDPLPGQGAQALHEDAVRTDGNIEQNDLMNSMWMLDDVTEENGATRIVPGSHRWSKQPRNMLEHQVEPHPDQALLTGKSGTVAVFNGHAWHSCTQNRTTRPRRMIHGAFIARELPQQTNQRKHLRPETAKRLSPAARFILDV